MSIEKINKVGDNKSTLYKAAFSIDSLLIAYSQIKSRPGNVTLSQEKKAFQGVCLNWFRTTSHKLLKGLFVYPKLRRVSTPLKLGLVDNRLLTLNSPRIKIIERSILNALEPVFEGRFKWKKIDKSEYDFRKSTNTVNTLVVSNKLGYFKKD